MSAGAAGTRRIRSKEDGVGIFGSWLSTLIYCALAFPLFYVFAFKAKSIGGGLVSGFFAAFGVVYLGWTLHLTFNRFKFGEVHLNLPPQKPALGGELAGSIILPARAAQATRVRVELRCLKVVYNTDSKGNSHRSEEREWYEEKFFAVRRSGARAEAQFRMKIPDEPVISRDKSYIWEVQVVADLPGVDLSRSFVIEVDRPPPSPRPALPAAAARVAAPSAGGFAPAQAFAVPKAVRPAQPVGSDPAVAPASAAAVPLAARGNVTTGMTATRPAAAPVQAAAHAEPESAMPIAALIAANMVPLAGVLFLGWKVGDVVLLYWLENLIIGLMNLARIASAQPDAVLRNANPGKRVKPHELLIGKIVMGGFFLVHYGAFCAGHATFLSFMFPVKGPDGRELEIGGLMLHLLADPGIILAVLALLASHLVSFFRNYLGRGEYRRADMARLMMRPYGRIVVVHLFILGGGFLVTFLKSPLIAMALFVIIKTAVDLHMHRRERTLLAG